MEHEGGKDPTPQGRIPGVRTAPHGGTAEDVEAEKYHNSAPGPQVREDGAYFLGYKRENAYPGDATKQP